MTKKKAIVSWSTGKDSAYAYHKALQSGEYDIDEQARQLGVPIIKVHIPWPCTNDIYEEKMREAVAEIKTQGVTHMIFGDLFLEDIRNYREEKMAGTGLNCVFPLWGIDTTELAKEMVASGLRSVLVCIDPKALDAGYAGIDPCGENGEFHTAVIAGPMFDSPIDFTLGEVLERSGFVYADVCLTSVDNSSS